MSIYPELHSLTLLELEAKWKPETPGVDPLYYDEVALEMRRFDPEGLMFLMEEFRRSQGSRLASVILGLSMPASHDPAVLKLFMEGLDNPSGGVVSASLDALRNAKVWSIYFRIKQLKLTQTEPLVQGAILRYMAAGNFDDAFPVLLEALLSPHAIVRENAADELGERRLQGDVLIKAIEKLNPLLKDEDANVRQAARTALLFLKNTPQTD